MIQSELIGSCRLSAMPPTAMAAMMAKRAPMIFLMIAFICARLGAPQPAQRLRIACDERLAVAMPAAAHDLDAGPPHTVDQLAAACEDPAVQDLIAAPLGERRMGLIEGDKVERCADGEPGRIARRAAEGLAAARERSLEQVPAGRDIGPAGEHVACAMSQALRILERAQFACRIEDDV